MTGDKLMRLLLITFSVLLASLKPALSEDLTVFAAASLTGAVKTTAQRYEAASGDHVALSFAASSVLARQIEAGAPAALFISADIAWVDYLAERGFIAAGTRADIASNQLVLVTSRPVPAGFTLAQLPALIGAKGRLAVGDPDHVPAGRYARQSLEALGLWTGLENRLARADNVRAALALVTRGEAPAALVYATDAALTPGLTVAAVLPAASHAPVIYQAAIMEDAGRDPAAHRFLSYLKGPEAGGILASYGFLPPPATADEAP